MKRIEVRIRMTSRTTVTRHLTLAGCERALCGVLTLRAPQAWEGRAPRCQRCESHLAALESRL